MKTVAIYQKTEHGLLRLGTFTPKKYYSVDSVIDQFCAKHPNVDPSTIGVATRSRSFGKVVDGAVVFRTPVKYAVNWDNGSEDCYTAEVIEIEEPDEEETDQTYSEWMRGATDCHGRP